MDRGCAVTIPEKAVFYRRLPHCCLEDCTTTHTNRMKDIWTSRLDTVLQKDRPYLTHKLDILHRDEDKGDFMGPDVREVWLGGGPSGIIYANDSNDDKKRIPEWPDFYDKLGSYPLFQGWKLKNY
jgi:hypothetical protein